MVAVRRHLHSQPELSYREHETSRYVQAQLSAAGIPFQNGIADTGIVAVIEGKNPHKVTTALRADMDALPIHEENDVSYKSKYAGIMHACGHDAHTSALLGAARILHSLRHEWEGTVRCIFQPAEEKAPGGASLMIRDGVLQNPTPNSIIGQHVFPMLPAGMVGFRRGRMMASSDEISISIKGRGGHGAVPQLSIDPIAISAQVVVALQQLVSRIADPIVPSVLTLGKIYSVGGTHNVIPEEVRIEGTFRTMDEKWRFEAHERIRRIVLGVAESMGAKASIDIVVGYPFLVNDDALTERCIQAAIDYLGADKVRDIPIRMTSEDFAYYTHHIPGCFYRLGTADFERGITSQVHTPTFDIDEAALVTGAGLMSWLSLNELATAISAL
ncbi:MAG: amidohydrolase [Chitinophagales bacterium]|nr:amidohydrolase [Chitinophagales bacterium]